ncbi:MAG: hypothetical protein OXD42_11955 [Rhodospirillaceae bacterium]|nr:hypothetical protein [Rhodospirillaceae bacterium]
MNHEDQAQGTAGAARARRRCAAARRSRATASAYPVPTARGDASGQRRRAGLPAASSQGRPGQWSVRVSGNWRVVFRFEDGEAVDVDLIDYH